MPYGEGAMEILGWALNEIENQGFDFSTLSTKTVSDWGGDREVIRAINLIYTGNPTTWSEGMWHHQGWYSSFSADGVGTEIYACGDGNEPFATMATIHEDGHMIGGWPDVYLYSGEDNPIQGFCIMGGGWGTPPPNPYFRTAAGWSDVVDITG